jgi:hypothetical protein
MDKHGDTESGALAKCWYNLGPLISLAIQDLGREEGLALANDLSSGKVTPCWTLSPGHAVCLIYRGPDVTHRFEFFNKPIPFRFAELGPAN